MSNTNIVKRKGLIILAYAIGLLIINSVLIKASNIRPQETVIIAPNAILMPPGKILLINKDDEYGAIKFIKIWTGKTKEDWYAEYESYYITQKDRKKETKNKMSIKRHKLSSPRPRGIGRFSFSFGNKEIECGPFRLSWRGKGSVYFYGQDQPEGDYGIGLSPTGWSEFDQINLNDDRLIWYFFDLKRERKTISIDEIWRNAGHT